MGFPGDWPARRDSDGNRALPVLSSVVYANMVVKMKISFGEMKCQRVLQYGIVKNRGDVD